MRLIVTRPQERALPLAEKLKAEGFEPLLAPMLKIFPLPVEDPAEPLQAVIFTSVQGVEAVAGAEGYKIFPAYTVGSKTAGAARKAGFGTVLNADGAVDDLFRMIKETGNPAKGPLVHLCGDQTVGKLAERLTAEGFAARRQKVYETRAIESLPASVAEKTNARAFEGALFFSPRTANIFCRVAADSGLEDSFGHATAFCLSDSVAEEASRLKWKKVVASEQPNEASLLSLLQGLRK